MCYAFRVALAIRNLDTVLLRIMSHHHLDEAHNKYAINDSDIEILHVCEDTLVKQAHLGLNFSIKEYGRLPLPNGLEDSVELTWRDRVAENHTLWNGAKFRLHSFSQDSSGRLTWNVGLTCYKDFIGTNMSGEGGKFRDLGRELHHNSQAFMADPLGVGALVLTSDEHCILLKRSIQCAEAAGFYDVPGGHPEPEEIAGKMDVDKMNQELFTADTVVNEIYTSILREIRDEVNIPANELSPPLLMGVALNNTTLGRPSSEYLVRTPLTSSDVVKRYRDGGHAEEDESTDIITLPHHELLNLPHTDRWKDLAPSAKGCISLYLYYYKSRPKRSFPSN